ncbi:MAG: STAS domain-containing protein [Planctomycetaceae bacterium]
MEQITWDDLEGQRWIQLEGDLDVDACNRIEAEFRSAVEGGEGDVVVVLDGVPFMTSRGLGMLIQAHQILRDKGRRLTVKGLRPNVRRMFDSVGLSQLLDTE